MLLFLGNCQSDYISRAMTEQGHACEYRVQASPFTYPSHPGAVPASLAGLDKKMDLSPYFHGRSLNNQFRPVDTKKPPRVIILNLFHENTPLLVHNTDKYTFFLDPKALEDKPELMDWTQNNCSMIQPNPATYLKRYRNMLATIRTNHPATPILIVSRLTHFPAFGPNPFSYLSGWSDLGPGAMNILSGWAEQMDNVHIIDMNRVFGGIWKESDKNIDSHCPFLKITMEEEGDTITSVSVRRDVEHIESMPNRLADKLTEFLETGSIEYRKSETIPAQWESGWRVTPLCDEDMLKALTSGNNYQCAKAVGSFLLDTSRDYTEFLVQTRKSTPVCHMLLHMIKAYSRIWRNPELASWCEAHHAAAQQFTANGPLYREAYLNRVEEIRRFVRG